MPKATSPLRILGIDPGLNHTGFGVIDVASERLKFVTAGCIHVPNGALAERLGFIFREVSKILAETQPTQAAAEIIFLNTNPKTTLLLGQARGAALASLAQGGVRVDEFSATAIKNAIVGTGRASKVQVQTMVAHLLGLSEDLQADAADALACAITCAHALKLSHLGQSRERLAPHGTTATPHRARSRAAWEKFAHERSQTK